MADNRRARNAPEGLSQNGKTLWGDITREYELRADELVILEQACRTLDLVDRLERNLADPNSHTTAKGSKNQVIVNPLIQEIRQQRSTLKVLLAGLGLAAVADDEPSSRSARSARSAGGRTLALARWGNAN